MPTPPVPFLFRTVQRTGALAALTLTIACSPAASPSSPTPAPSPVVAAPELTCPASIRVTTAASGAAVAYDLPAARGGEAPVTVSCVPPSGQTFPVGETEVRCTATDRRGQAGTCGFTVGVTRLPTFAATRLVAFGDSVTEGIVATRNPAGDDPFFLLRPVPQASYPTVLGQLLSARYASQSIAVVNAGKGGEKAVDGVGRFSGVIRTERPDVVIILDGYNDLGVGAPGIAPGLAAINDMVKIARFQGVRVFLATLTPPNPQGGRGLSNSVITAFNRGLEDIARGENVGLVDVYAAMVHDPNRYNSDDGRHPNEAGYRKIAETVFASLQAGLEAR